MSLTLHSNFSEDVSLVSRKGPTYTLTRTLVASVTDYNNIIKQVASGEERYTGARRVENLALQSESLDDWTVYGGTWSRNEDSVSQSSTSVIGARLMCNQVNYGTVAAEMIFSFDDIDSYYGGNAGPLFRMDSSVNGWNCAIREESGTAALRHYKVEAAEVYELGSDNMSSFSLGVNYRLTAYGYNDALRCYLANDSSQTDINDGNYQSGAVGIRTTRAAITVHSFIVYELGGSLP